MARFIKTLNGNETDEEIESLFWDKWLKGTEIGVNDELRIDLDFNAFIDEGFVKNLLNKLNDNKDLAKFKFVVTSNRIQNCIVDQNTIQDLKISNDLAKQNNINVTMFDEITKENFEMDDVIKTNEKIYESVDKIRSANVDGKKLSPYEQFLYAYNIVAAMEYKKGESGDRASVSRHLVNAMTSDKKVCVAFAARLTLICNKLDIPCINQLVTGHQVSCVYLKDEKYDIDGIYISDPTAKNFDLSLISPHLFPTIVDTIYNNKMEYLICDNKHTINNKFANFYASLPQKVQEKNRKYFEFRSNIEDKKFDAFIRDRVFAKNVDSEFSNEFKTIIYYCVLNDNVAFSGIKKNKEKITKYFEFTDMELFYEYMLNQVNVIRDEIIKEDKNLTDKELKQKISKKLFDEMLPYYKVVINDSDKIEEDFNDEVDFNKIIYYKDDKLEEIKYPQVNFNDTLLALSKVYMSINEELDRDKAWGLAKYVLRRTNLCTKSTDLEYYEKLVKKLESKQTKDEKYLEVVDMYKQLVEALEPEQVLEV